MNRLAVLLFSLVLVLGGCTVVTDPDVGTAQAISAAEGFSVRASGGRLFLRNISAVRVHYVVLEEETATRVDVNPDFTQWPSLAPGAEVRIPYSEISGYTPGATRAVIHWATGAQNGYLRVDLK